MTSGEPRAVVALDIGGTKIASAIGDAGGELRRWRTLPTEAERGAERVLESAIALANEVLREERANGGDVRAIGISTMGLTRVDRVDLAPNVPGWEGLKIPAAIATAFPALPAAFGNDVKLAALAELTWGALADVSSGVYLNLGTGIAADSRCRRTGYPGRPRGCRRDRILAHRRRRDAANGRRRRVSLRRRLSAAGVSRTGPVRSWGGRSRSPSSSFGPRTTRARKCCSRECGTRSGHW